MMKNQWMILLTAATLALGCSQAERSDMASKADQSMQQAEQTAKKEVKKAGQALDEGMSSTRIKSALLASKKLDASNINVDTAQKTVFLRGSVKTEEQKKLANDLTNNLMEPDQKLVNELKIAAHPDPNRPQ
ncbi:MAG: BON domain-containing protein [Candidatus Eremiobacteraeota bacterium]|nr:BON domain-containing protein [Candidatus Eremiobacteraeota bacterium]